MIETREVRKYPVEVDGRSELRMPKGAQILKFESQLEVTANPKIRNTNLVLWALVDPRAPDETRYLRVVATGEKLSVPLAYYGTVEVGFFVFHLFEFDGPKVIEAIGGDIISLSEEDKA